MKEPVPEREPAAGRGGEGPLIPSGYRSPPDGGAGNPPLWAKGSAESRNPAGAEPSLQPLCHPPPPGKSQGGKSGTTVAQGPYRYPWVPQGHTSAIGAARITRGVRGGR